MADWKTRCGRKIVKHVEGIREHSRKNVVFCFGGYLVGIEFRFSGMGSEYILYSGKGIDNKNSCSESRSKLALLYYEHTTRPVHL